MADSLLMFREYQPLALKEAAEAQMQDTPEVSVKQWEQLERIDDSFQFDRIRGRVRDHENAPIEI